MLAGLPLDDPQFWAVTALVVLVIVLAARRIVRALRTPSACASCPKAPVDQAAGTPAPRRLPRLPLLLALPTLLVLDAPPLRGASAGEGVVRRLAAMGTTLEIRVDGLERSRGLEVAEAIARSVEAAERRLSTWRDDSEIARLNRAPVGAAVELAPETARALRAAMDCAEATAGAFDPTVAPLVEVWGLRRGGRTPSAEEIAAARERVDWRELALDHGRAVRRGDVRVEEGGFGKGAALDEALALARELAPRAEVALDFGGQLAWTGGSGERRVRLADPRDRARAVLELRLERSPGSVSTSSDSERAGHLLDPRTGRPAADFGSATVVAGSAARADCASTGLFVLGPGGAARSAAAPDEERVLLVAEEGRLRALVSRGLAGRVHRLVDELTIETLDDSS